MSEPKQLSEIERLKTENANLRAQLDQTVEELRFYFKKCQELGERQEPPSPIPEEPSSATKCHQQSGEDIVASIDLRHLIDGDNWHKPEEKGRWAGPETASKIRLPALQAGSYRLEIVVTDAMASDIIDQLRVCFDGQEISLKRTYRPQFSGVLAPLKKWKALLLSPEKAYPITLHGKVSVNSETPNERHQLDMKFPRTISPASSGGTDDRQLALRVSDIILRR